MSAAAAFLAEMPVLLAIAPLVIWAIGTAITVLTSILLAPGQRGVESSQTYGLDRLDNNRGEGAPIPIILGTRNLIEPQLISAVTKQAGDVQSFNLLYLLGYGELGSMDADYTTRLKINGQPPESYPGLRVTFRYGTGSQTAIAGFDRFGRSRAYNTTLGKDDVLTHEMPSSADEVHILMAFQQGVYRISTGLKQVKSSTPGVRIEFKDADSATASWQYASIDAKRNPDWRNYDVYKTQAKEGHWFFTATTQSVLRKQIEFRFPARGRYYVRITGLWDNTSQPEFREPTITSVNDVTQESRTYAGYALMALEGVATENLSGGLPTVSLLSTGLKLTDPRSGTSAPSANPGVILYGLLLSSTWGAGYASTDLHAAAGQSFRTFMDTCDTTVSVSGAAAEKGFECHYVIDSRAPVEDHIERILLGCRAVLYEQDGQIRIVQDAAVSSVRTFDARQVTTNRRNVLADDAGAAIARDSTLPDEERFNAVVVQYVDAEDDTFEQRIYQYPEGTVANFKPKEIVLLGVTRRTQAKREAIYQYNLLVLTPDFLELGISWGDHDLVPLDRITYYDDFRYSSGSDWKVYDIRFGADGRGRLVCRKYDATVYGATAVTSSPTVTQVGGVTTTGPAKDTVADSKGSGKGQGSGNPSKPATGFKFQVSANA